jgi:hypothetical protein
MSTNPSFVKNASFQGIIGAAQRDITPPVGIYARSWGAAVHDVAEGIHRCLQLTCITFQASKAEEPLVLIGADLGWWKSSDDENALRNGILEALALEESRLMVCLSHTHAGPSLFSEDQDKPGGHLIAPYLNHLLDQSIAAAKEALAKATSATLTWNFGKCDLAVNRDLPDPSNDRLVVAMNPANEADDTLLVGRITNDQQEIVATLVNYACHPTTLAWDNRLISPDYIGAMREVVESATGAPTLFLQGASGELSPREQYVGDVRVADHYGRQLGYAALSVLEAQLAPQTGLAFTNIIESGATLGIWSPTSYTPSSVISVEKVDVPLTLKPMPSLAEFENAWKQCDDNVEKERLWRKRGIRKTVGDGDVSQMPLWVWRLGDSFLIGQPNETYSEFQLELRKKLAPNAVAAINIVNGYAGYLPPKELYKNTMYTVWQTPFAAGGLEQITEIAATTAQQMLS